MKYEPTEDITADNITHTNCRTCNTELGYYPIDTTDSNKNCLNETPIGYYQFINGSSIMVNSLVIAPV